jgi:hypothetical protein
VQSHIKPWQTHHSICKEKNSENASFIKIKINTTRLQTGKDQARMKTFSSDSVEIPKSNLQAAAHISL